MKKIFLLLTLIVIFAASKAQTSPGSDNPCDAQSWPVFAADVLSPECLPIQTIAYVIQYANATLTGGIPNPSCVLTNSQNIRDVWVRCQVPASGRLSIRITEGFPDLVLAAYTRVGGCAGTYTEIGCNNDYFDINPRLQLSGLTPFTEVYVRIFNNPTTVVTSGTFRMCISDYYNNLPIVDNSTKVGIGALTPFAKLDVAGTGIFRDKTFFAKDIEARGRLKLKGGLHVDSLIIRGAGFPGEYLTSDVNGVATWQALPVGANVWGSAGANIYNNNTGNVGIGTTAPTYKLHFGYANNGLRIEGPEFSASGGAALSIGGFGDIAVDKPGVVGGRFTIKENGNVGIGTDNPSVALSFANTVGDKISLFSNSAIQQYGLGIVSNTMQLFAPNTSDIAFGTGNSAGFTENLRIKGNGALAVQSNTGTPGQVLTSNGSGGAATWMSPLAHSAAGSIFYPSVFVYGISVLTSITRTITIPAGQSARLLISANIGYEGGGCIGVPCTNSGILRVLVDGVESHYVPFDQASGKYSSLTVSNFPVDVSSGLHTIQFKLFTGDGASTFFPTSSTIIAIPL